MAVRFSSLKGSILLILYDYMLTADHEGFWFDIPAIQEGLPSNVGGAFVQRALDALISEKLVELGGSAVLHNDLFALTEHGIKAAEDLIEERGLDIDDYEPAPEADKILSRLHDAAAHAEISNTLGALQLEIQKSNAFDSELQGNGDLLEGEIKAASTLMSSARIRVSRLKFLLIPALKALSKTFADQSIGEISKRLIALLFDLDKS